MHISRVGSVLGTLSVTLERFFAIVYPLKRIEKTKFLIYLSLVGSIVYNIPRFFEFETAYEKVTHTSGNTSNTTINDTMYGEEWRVRMRTFLMFCFSQIAIT